MCVLCLMASVFIYGKLTFFFLLPSLSLPNSVSASFCLILLRSPCVLHCLLFSSLYNCLVCIDVSLDMDNQEHDNDNDVFLQYSTIYCRHQLNIISSETQFSNALPQQTSRYARPARLPCRGQGERTMQLQQRLTVPTTWWLTEPTVNHNHRSTHR